MNPASREEFAEATAFERLVLEDATPPHNSGLSAATVDFRRTPGSVDVAAGLRLGVTVGETIGRGDGLPGRSLRPLLFGAAFKVADLMLEGALEAATVAPRRPPRWSITEKVGHAKDAKGTLAPLTDTAQGIWQRVCALYVSFEQVRHSLVHRTAQVEETTGALTGVDDRGRPLTSVSMHEQEQFCRLAVELSQVVLSGSLGGRAERLLAWRLNELASHHGLSALPDAAAPHTAVQVLANLDPLQDGRWHVDVGSALAQAKAVLKDASEFNGSFHAECADGRVRIFQCQMEDAPDEADFHLDSPPPWLRERA